jgi:hypothetical protein
VTRRVAMCTRLPAALLACVALLACTPQRQESGMAQVNQTGGKPCFVITPSQPASDVPYWLTQIQVVDADGRTMWQATLTPPGNLNTGQCLPYGQQIPGAVADVPARPLLAGAPYRLALIASEGATPGSTRGYTADFNYVGPRPQIQSTGP